MLCLSTFYYGWIIVDLSSLPKSVLESGFSPKSIQPGMYGILQGCVPLGAAFGAFISPFLMKIFSRKYYFFNIEILS